MAKWRFKLPYQERIHNWMIHCFGWEITHDPVERGDRLLEEVLELLQSADYPFERVPMITAYVNGRPKGEPIQEMGGTMVTLCAFANVHNIDVMGSAEVEYARISEPDTMARIREKQKSKPKGLAIPQPQETVTISLKEYQMLKEDQELLNSFVGARKG